MSFNPYAPYGPLASSTIRVVTWNVWGRYGTDFEARQAALEQTLEQTAPDLVCLVEACARATRLSPAGSRLGWAWLITGSLVTGSRRTGCRASVSSPGGP